MAIRYTTWRGLAILLTALSASGAVGEEPGGAPTPAAPSLPGEVVVALQGRKFAEARTALAALRNQATSDDDRAYLDFLTAVADRLDGRNDAARDALRKAMADFPASVWLPKIRYELAALELAAGEPARAEELARASALPLLADDRKDRLADVYKSFARGLLNHDDPVTPADPQGARDLLDQARLLAKGAATRADLTVEIARVSRLLNDHDRAVKELEARLREYPGLPGRSTVRQSLGEALLAAGRPVEARSTWSDLVRDVERTTPENRTRDDDRARADALAAIPATYGVPEPPDARSLALGIAALERFLAAAPDHPRAVRAAFDLGLTNANRGQTDAALAAFERFRKGEGFRAETDDARKEAAELAMTATFLSGRLQLDQKRFDEAVATWQGYLSRFPDGPQGAEAQHAILDAKLARASDLAMQGKAEAARAGWSEFAAENPLHPLVPEILFQIGQSHYNAKEFDRAIAAWAAPIGKFPDSEPAAHAQFLIATIQEVEKGAPAEAVETYRKVKTAPWAAEAATRIAAMEAKSLTVVTPRTFRSGESPVLKIDTRNLERLTFTAYKLNAESYFRKKHGFENVESLDIGLVAPDAEWTEDVPGYAKLKPIEADYALKDLKTPGVYVVKVTDQKTLQATTLVVASDLDAVVKTSRDQVLVFAQDMKTGAGRPNARVLASDGGRVVLEGTTGPDGVLLHDWKPARDPGRLTYLVVDGPHVAGSKLGVEQGIARGIAPRAYIDTDRPAYRPGQTVQIRGVVREAKVGRYDNAPGAVYRFETIDSLGRRIAARDVALSEFGTFHESVPIDSAAPAGAYRIRVFQPGKSEFAGAFQVRSYELQSIDLSFDLPRRIYYRGETVEGAAVARFSYGAPAAGKAVEVALPDGRTLRGKTDAEGKFPVAFSTEGFAESQRINLTATLPEDGVQGGAALAVAVEGFSIDVSTDRDVYLDGETFAVRAVVIDALGAPAAQKLSATLVKLIVDRDRLVEREIEKKPLQADEQGRGSVDFRIEDDRGGRFLVRLSGIDRFGNAIVADHPLFISGKDDQTTLRLIADRTSLKAGEPAKVNLHSRGRSGPCLLTWDADRILSYKIVPLKEGDNEVAWEVDGDQFPNFTLTAARMWRDKLDSARLDLHVERDLHVVATPAKPRYGPGEPIEVELTTVDQLGRPVAAELSLAVVDVSLLKRYADLLPDIGGFFYDQVRTGAFSVSSTNTFRYAPATTSVSQAVVDDAERQAAAAADAQNAEQVRGMLGELASRSEASAPMPGQPPSGMMGGGMGGMGGAGQPAANAPAKRKPDRSRRRASQGAFGSDPATDDETQVMDASPLGFRDARKDLGRSTPDRGPSPRQRFVETAYWNPAVVTGADGKTKITFPAPEAMSEYRIMAKGVTGTDTLAGQASSTIQIRREFFVDLKVPPALTQGDRPRFVARVHHLGVAGPVALKLTVNNGREQTFPKTLDVKGDGVDEVTFEPIEVAEGAVALTLSATLGERRDSIAATVPVRPWGVQAFASASGSSRDGATAFVSLPPGRSYENPAMRILISPNQERLIVEIAMGRDVQPMGREAAPIWTCFPPDTTADRASELLAAASALSHLRRAKAANPGDVQRLVGRIQGLVSQLTAAQRQDGGWGWMAAAPDRPENNKQVAGGDRYTTASAFWAIIAAEDLGLLPDPAVREKATAWLQAAIAATDPRDRDARAAILHALSLRNRAGFEAANSLNRERTGLSNAALAHLALTFANLGRPELAAEALTVLGPRAKVETPAPGRTPRIFWEAAGQAAGLRSTAETTALAALAFARIRPGSDEAARSVAWLEAHRSGLGWNPPKARGPAVAALAAFHGETSEGDRYRLSISVNDRKVHEAEVAGGADALEVAVPTDALKTDDANRIAFAIEGRGTIHYAVELTGFAREFGPDQDRNGRPAIIDRRVYWPAAPELDGKALPVGFSTTVNASTFENVVTGTPLGRRARVGLVVWRNIPSETPEWDRDFLVVDEPLPAGTTLIEDSVVSSAASYTYADGVLTFYFPPDRNPGSIQYDVYGGLPGVYRTLPARVRSADEPGRFHLGAPGVFTVRTGDEPDPDQLRPTPDELYARGKALFDAGRLAEAGPPLETLFNDWTLRDDVARDAARMRLLIHIAGDDARKIVRDFEVVKERSPDLILSFEQLQAIGKAYRDIDEHERAMIVWRGLIEASYVEDARVGELLRQRGEPLDATAYLVDLWRRYPNTPSIESDFFGLSQIVADAATRSLDDPYLRRKMTAAGVTRSGLLLHAARMIQTFLAQSPTNPTADEASLALLGTVLELEDYQAAVKAASQFAAIYPRSPFLDGFQYSQAFADFHLGRYDEAVTLAEAIAAAVYKDASGVEAPSPNKWQAVFILGQIFDARRMPAKALEYYRQTADRFTDAADAVAYYTRKALKIDEVTVVRPPAAPAADAPGATSEPPPQADGKARLALSYRNIPRVDVTVHPVDLMQLYLSRRNLDAIAGVDLAGITPIFEQTIELGSGEDYEDRTKTIELPLSKTGAYLVMIRGGDLYASGVVLMSSLEVDVQEDVEAGRVRAVVRDARSRAPASRVQVKVVGSADAAFRSGETDLRGVYSAEGLTGAATVIVRKGGAEYAFHRGGAYLRQQPPPGSPAEATPADRQESKSQSLDANLKSLNRSNNLKQIERLQNRYQVVPQQAPGAAAGEFR